jgi:hypothetical protein
MKKLADEVRPYLDEAMRKLLRQLEERMQTLIGTQFLQQRNAARAVQAP